MCEGKFNSDGVPVIEALPISNAFDMKKSIEFHIDTGAGKTTIGILDAFNLMLDQSQLTEEHTVTGISGDAKAREIEDVLLVFRNEPSDFKESFHIEFIDKILYLPTSPYSLLGRDVLDRFEVSYCKRPEKITLSRNDQGEGSYLVI